MSSSSASETDQLLEGFADYLRRERAVSMFTVDLYVADVRRFLAGGGDRDLRELTSADVSHAVLGQVGGWSPASVRRFGCALRSSSGTALSPGWSSVICRGRRCRYRAGDDRCCPKASRPPRRRPCYAPVIGDVPPVDATTR